MFLRSNILILLFLVLTLNVRADFVFRISDDKGTLDWNYGEVNQDIILQLMRGLTFVDENSKTIPAIAESWKKQGTKKIIFNLRKNAKWSDSKNICADQFKDSWLRVLNPDSPSPYAHLLFDVKGAKNYLIKKTTDPNSVGIKTNGCYELVVELENENNHFPELVSHWVLFPIRKDLINKNDWFLPGNLVTNGPYTLSAWKKDQRVECDPNKNYFGEIPTERLIAKVVSNDQTALDLFNQNEFDWIRDIPIYEKKKAKEMEGYLSVPTYVSYHLGFNLDSKNSLPKNVRCALSKAIDRDEINKVLQGDVIPRSGFLEIFSLTNSKRSSSKSYLQIPGKIKLEYYTKEIHIPLVQWIQGQWEKKLGIKVELIASESKVYWNKLSDRSSVPQIFLSGITASYSHPFAFLSEFQTDSIANWGRFSSKDYDRWIQMNDKNLWTRAEKLLLDEECAVVQLYQRATTNLISKKYSGFNMNALARVDLSKIKKSATK